MLASLALYGKKIFNLMKPRTKFGAASFIVFSGLALAFFVIPLLVSADVITGSQIAGAIFGELGKIMLDVAGVLLRGVSFVIRFVIEIASYNDYINSTAVNYGWTLVRDMANMFFVVILLVIAFATVLGVESYGWRKLLVKFVLAAILVNFSRVICGVIIDAAQVFMMTFLNGVAAVAVGNIVNVFHMDSILSLSTSTSADVLTSTSVFVACMVAVFLAAISLATIGGYLVILLSRIVTLWILIVLSPLAFILGILPQTAKYSSQWWKEFTNSVIAGPILVFFLWLSFAVVGDGNVHGQFGGAAFSLESAQNDILATEQGGGSSLVIDGVSKALEWSNLASFIIAIGLLLAGVKATKELGVIGAGALGSAVDFGKKLGMAATGITAARWFGKRQLESGKLIAQNLGLRAMTNWNRKMETSYFGKRSEQGKASGWSRAGVAGAITRGFMFGTHKDMVDTRKKELETRQKLFAGSIGAPEGYKQKVANAEEELRFSGMIKEGVKAGRAFRAHEKVKGKPTASGKTLSELAYGKQTEQALLGEAVKRSDEIGLGKAKEATLGKEGKKYGLTGEQGEKTVGELVSTRWEEADKATRKANVKMSQSRDKTLAAELGLDENLIHIYEDHERGKQFREDQEIFDDMSYEALITLSGQQTEKYKSLSEAEKNSDAGKLILKNLNTLQATANARSAGTGKDAMEKITGELVKGTGNIMTVGADNIAQAQAEMLTDWLGELVEASAGGVQDALAKLKQREGSNFHSFMTQQVANMDKAAEGGAINMTGLFKLNEGGNDWENADESYRNDKRTFAIATAKGRTKGFKFAADQEYDEAGKVSYKVETDQAIRNVVALHSGMNRLQATRMNNMDVETWKTLIKNSDQERLNQLFLALSRDTGEGALEVLRDRIASSIAAESLSEAERAQFLNKIRDMAANPGGGRRADTAEEDVEEPA